MPVSPTLSALILDATSIGKALITGSDQAACRATLGVYSTGAIDSAFLAVTNSLNAKADLVATKVPTAQLGSGTANSTTFLRGDQTWAAIDLSGYVAGPAGAVTDNAVVRWDTTTGRLVQNSGVTISDAGAVNITVQTATTTGLTLKSSDDDLTNSIFEIQKADSSKNFIITSAGRVGIRKTPGNYTLDVEGNITNGSIANFSYGSQRVTISTSSYLTVQGLGSANGIFFGGNGNKAMFGTLGLHNTEIWTNGVARCVFDGTTGGATFTAGAATTIPLTVKAAASQTANLTEWQSSSGTVGARITAAREFSNDGGQTSSEKFGELAVVGATRATAFGYNAACNGAYSVAIGYNSSANANGYAVAIGDSAVANGSSIAIGMNSQANHAGGRCIAIGRSAYANNANCITIGSDYTIATGNYAITLGVYASASHSSSLAIGHGMKTTANGQVVIGNSVSPYATNWYLGNGVVHTAPVNITINGTGGSGTNIAGANIVIAGGQGTGTGAGGSFKVQVAPAGVSGSSANALVDALTIDSTAAAVLPNPSLSAVGVTVGSNAGRTAPNIKLIGFSSDNLNGGGGIEVGDGTGTTQLRIFRRNDNSHQITASGGASTHLMVTTTYGDILLNPTANKVGIGTTAVGAQLQVTAGASTTIGQIIRLAASHTANALEVQNNAGTVLSSFNASGHVVVVSAGSGGNTTLAGSSLKIGQSSGSGYLYATSDDSIGAQFRWGSTGGAGVAFASTSFIPTSNAAMSLGLSSYRWNGVYSLCFVASGQNNETALNTISTTCTWNNGGVTFPTHWKANVTDTASATATLLLDLQVNSTSKFSLRKDGLATFGGPITPASLADAAVPNNSIYYSTDASKLVYKDSGGTVNNLY